MKRFNLLSAVIAVVLMVTAVSCTTMRGTEDDYYYDRTQYDRVQPSNRIYVDDPYRGTIVLERDPYTGRYYEVGSYGGNYGYRNDRYSNVYRNNTRYNKTYNGNRNGTYNRNNNTSSQSQTEDQNRNQKREEARNKVLGK